MKRLPFTIAATAVMTLLIGCCLLICGARYTDGFVATSGVVLLNGEPLSGADIFMLPVDGQSGTQSYHGSSDANGVYEVTGGMPPGEYRVVIRHDDIEKSRSYQSEIDQGQVQAMMASKALHNPRQSTTVSKATSQNEKSARLPAIYRSADLTTLRIRIQENGSNDAHLFLTSDAAPQIAKTDDSKRTTR